MKCTLVIAITLFCNVLSLNGQIQKGVPVLKKSDLQVDNYSGIIVDAYADGRPSLWKEMNNGKAEGQWLEWYPNGKLRYKATWKNGKGHGRWQYYYSNGQLRSESFYIDDIAQGIYQSYYKNNQLKLDLTYINGKKNGEELLYDETGVLISRIKYDDDKIVIDEPIIFEGGNISNPEDNEWGINFTPDGKEAYFTRRSAMTGEKRIYLSKKKDGKWSKPTVASFSNSEDESPFISKDGKTLLFASYRPLTSSLENSDMDMNLWQMDRKKGSWTDPILIANPISKAMIKDITWPENYEAGPVLDSAGNLYYWTKGKNSNATNIYMASKSDKGVFNEPKELVEPSSNKHFDTTPCFAMNDQIMIFGSDNRPSGYGESDLFYSMKVDNQWTAPVNLGPVVNSSKSEGSPSLSSDGKYFFFSSNRGGKMDINGEPLWDIYYMETKYLQIK